MVPVVISWRGNMGWRVDWHLVVEPRRIPEIIQARSIRASATQFHSAIERYLTVRISTTDPIPVISAAPVTSHM